jgi:arylsulfatase A
MCHTTIPIFPLAASESLIEKNKDAFHPVYAAMIEALDESVGRLIAKVDALGADRTNDLYLYERQWWPACSRISRHSCDLSISRIRAGKGYLYEGGLREPLIVRWPGVAKAGTTCDAPVVLTDLVPTLLHAAGIDANKQVGPLDGANLTDAIAGKALVDHAPCFGTFPTTPIKAADLQVPFAKVIGN